MARHLDLSFDYSLDGLQVPRQFYYVLRTPAPLAGMEYPGMGMPWELLFKAGITDVVCLCNDKVDYDPSPLRPLFVAGMDDLHHGNDPRDLARDEHLVRKAVDAIVEQLSKGKGVVVHCIGGTGRTGTVIGCTLRSMGYPADEVLEYLDELNKSRGRRGWPEAPWQADMVRRF